MYTVLPFLSNISNFIGTLGFKNWEPNILNAERPCTNVSGTSCTLKIVLSLSSKNTSACFKFSFILRRGIKPIKCSPLYR